MKSIPFKFTFWKAVLVVVLLAALYASIVRFAQGLGASTNLSDDFPWACGSASMCSAA